MYPCPKGHNSTEADFCSECGAKIMGVGIAETPSASTSVAAITGAVSIYPCPVCTTPHENGTGDFCEICGYNFMTGAQGGVPFPISSPVINTQPLPRTQLPPTPTTSISSGNPTIRWQAIISIDPSLASTDSPPAPVQPPISIELTAPTTLIGRTSQARAIHPEIPLDLDDAVSSRHAILTLHPDNSIVLRDIGSSNGTMVNGKEIAVMTDIQIRAGDEITLGHWTRIKLMNG